MNNALLAILGQGAPFSQMNATQSYPFDRLQQASQQNIGLQALAQYNVTESRDEREERNERNLRLWRTRFERDPLTDCEAR